MPSPKREPPPQLGVQRASSFKARKSGGGASPGRRPPVIVHVHPPKVHHATPGDFMGLVQSLTGNGKEISAAPHEECYQAVGRGAREPEGDGSSSSPGCDGVHRGLAAGNRTAEDQLRGDADRRQADVEGSPSTVNFFPFFPGAKGT